MNKERMRLAVKLGLGAVAKARKMRNPTDIKVIEATILKRPVRIAEKKEFHFPFGQRCWQFDCKQLFLIILNLVPNRSINLVGHIWVVGLSRRTVH